MTVTPTLTIQRYDVDTLEKMIIDLAYEDMALSNVRWENDRQVKTGESVFRMNLTDGLTNCTIYRDRIDNFTEKLESDKSLTKDQQTIYKRAIDLLYKLSDDEELTTMEYSKKLYEKEKNIYNSRFYHEFPLDKKINAFYDDLTVCFLFHCDISGIGNNRQALIRSYKGNERALNHFADLTWGKDKKTKEAFLALKNDDDRCAFLQEKFGEDYVDMFDKLSDEEKIEFVKQHVEFTHCLLGPVESSSWGIVLFGKVDPKFSSGSSSDQMALPRKFADFKNLTLADTMELKNNDLLQRLQTKIDIDRENLKVVDEKVVRGDLYKVLEAPKGYGNGRFRYLIRYVCPSTGRPYFNELDEQSLSHSKYYKSNDVNSFIHAWWNINNVGEDPFDEEDVIRC